MQSFNINSFTNNLINRFNPVHYRMFSGPPGQGGAYDGGIVANARANGIAAASPETKQLTQPKLTIRKYFPETWLWDSLISG